MVLKSQTMWLYLRRTIKVSTIEQFLEAQKRLTLAGNIVINVGGYIGQSTRSEIDYARSQGKTVEFLEEV